MSTWVQHISGTGKKWRIGIYGRNYRTDSAYWAVGEGRDEFRLPKSEYRECEGPEEWEDVTDKCELLMGVDGYPGLCYEGRRIAERGDCRISKVQLWKIKRFDYQEPSMVGAEFRYPPIPASETATQWAFIIEKRKP